MTEAVTSVSVTALKSSSLTFLPSNAAGLRRQKPTLVTEMCGPWPGRSCGSVPNQTAISRAICADSHFLRALGDLCPCQLCVTRKFVCCEHLLCESGVTRHRRRRVRSYLMPVILSSHLAVNCLLRFTMRVFSVGSCVIHNYSLELLLMLSRIQFAD